MSIDYSTALFDDKGRPIQVSYDEFSGTIYRNQDVATADTARRFSTSALKLRDCLILVTGANQLFGDSSSQTMEVSAGNGFALSKVDISTLYFKNATAGQNGTVEILGVRE